MKTFIIADTHFNHDKIKTYCERPPNFTELLVKNWNERVNEGDSVIHLGDVGIGPKEGIVETVARLNGRKILVRGNHDREKSNQWWMDRGFAFSCDAMMFRNWWLTHEPAKKLPWAEGVHCQGNIHGHLHNIFHGFQIPGTSFKKLINPWQRLFAVEYTKYYPIEFMEFVNHPDKYNARGIEHLDHVNQYPIRMPGIWSGFVRTLTKEKKDGGI